MKILPLTLAMTGVGLATNARAHFNLNSPPQVSDDMGGGKGAPPCGPDTGMSMMPAPATGGHPYPLSVFESTPHSGFYRVALAINSRSEFPVDNVVYDSNNMILPPNGMPQGISDHADYENPPVFPVLADNLFPHEANGQQTFTAMITLPNITCARCILQVIEFMEPHGYNTGGGYFYHHCAELAITADPNLPPFEGVDAGAGGGTADAGSEAGTGGTGGVAGAESGGAGGEPSSGGTGGAIATGGSAGQTSSSGSAGEPSGGAVATAGSTSTAGSDDGTSGSSNDSSGCGCTVVGRRMPVSLPLLGLGVSLLALARRQRRR